MVGADGGDTGYTMKRTAVLLTGGLLLGAIAVAATLLIALTSTGVMRTAPPTWTVDVRLLGMTTPLSVTGLLRLATLPGLSHLLAGHRFETLVGEVVLASEKGALVARCAPCTLRDSDSPIPALALDRAELALRRDGDRLTGTLRSGDLDVPFTAQLEAHQLVLHWKLPSTPIAAVVRAMAATIPEAQFARIDGTVQAQGQLSLPSRKSSVVFGLHGFEVGGLGTESLQSGWFRLPCADANGQARTVISGEGERSWAAADRLGIYLAPAVVAAEDQRFFEHAGIDESEIAGVLVDPDGRPRRGASTITQQLARTLFTGNERSATRKLREVLYAVEMERTLGKARILELYLNTVDWGPGLCGARAAARAYFNKTPTRLSPKEAAWLAAILRNPHLAHQRRFESETPERERAQWVLMQMREFPRSERARWSREPIAFAMAGRRADACHASFATDCAPTSVTAMSSRSSRLGALR